MGCGGSKNDSHHSQTSSIKFKETNGHVRTGSKYKSHKSGALGEEDTEDENLNLMSKERLDGILNSLSPGELFFDPDFPPTSQSLYCSNHVDKKYVWKRPYILTPPGQVPQMMVDGLSKEDIKQGILGDCWFLSSCAAVSQQSRFMNKIMPKDQILDQNDENYKGVILFRFWRFGEWVDVYIDDLLPTVDKKLIYAYCTDETEFWVPLIEKAYAKLHGSYEALEGGQTMDALVDLTGGLAERYELEYQDPNMYRLIQRAFKSGAFIACSIKGNWKGSAIADPNGLVSGHAYTITGITKISFKGEPVKLLRIRNPWGDSTEWKGSWSDDDSNWDHVDEETKQMLGVQSKDDGEFWISYKDFCKQFQEVTLCLTGPDFDGDGVTDRAGHVEVLKSEWKEGVNAGGSRNDIETFAQNPQILLTLTESDDFNPMTDDPESEGKCSVVISLMQEHRRVKKNKKVKSLQIAFMLYKTDDPTVRLTPRHFKYNPDCGKSGIYINYREVSGRFELEPGHYIIMPSTFQSNASAAFMLRVFGEKPFTLTGPLDA